MEKYEILKAYDSLKPRIDNLYIVLKIEDKEKATIVDEIKMAAPDFWNDYNLAQNIVSKVNHNKEIINKYQELKDFILELKEIIELDDFELFKTLDDFLNQGISKVNALEQLAMLNGEYDQNNCYLEIHPGAGGTESQDWALMLFRMYKRFAEREHFNFKVLDYLDGNEAGIKSVTCLIEGAYAYGLLQGENGVHRLVRISPFDANSRRHTSFAGVSVMPEVDEAKDITINPNDIRVDTYRSSGAGGQYVNTTDSAVRITHIPTGIVVSSQIERSQILNRAQCMKMLTAKLYALNKTKEQEMMSGLNQNTKDNAFGSQVRSYILQPYTLVKDHRTNYEVGNPAKVLDGELDGFINAYLKYKALGD